MRASIRTVEDYSPSKKGKTARIARSAVTIKPILKGKAVVSLELSATRSRNPGTGDRGGAFKAYTDTLKLELEPKDLKEILKAAIANGLISIDFIAKEL